MTPAAPQFPSLNVWEGMSEPEQDALIVRIREPDGASYSGRAFRPQLCGPRRPCALVDWSIWP